MDMHLSKDEAEVLYRKTIVKAWERAPAGAGQRPVLVIEFKDGESLEIRQQGQPGNGEWDNFTKVELVNKGGRRTIFASG